jgi:hypothetical protein
LEEVVRKVKSKYGTAVVHCAICRAHGENPPRYQLEVNGPPVETKVEVMEALCREALAEWNLVSDAMHVENPNSGDNANSGDSAKTNQGVEI